MLIRCAGGGETIEHPVTDPQPVVSRPVLLFIVQCAGGRNRMKHLFAFLTAFAALAAEPDWRVIDKHAIEFLQEYVRIPSTSPPSNTAPCARLFAAELERNGLKPRIFASGPAGQTNLVVRLKG